MRRNRRSLLEGVGALALMLLGGPVAKLRALEKEPDSDTAYMVLIGGPSQSMGSNPPVEHLTAESYPGKWTSPDGQGPELIPVEMGERPGLNFSTEGGVAA